MNIIQKDEISYQPPIPAVMALFDTIRSSELSDFQHCNYKIIRHWKKLSNNNYLNIRKTKSNK